ncbi:MAG TPA: CpaF family protein [Anaerolineales bacterium]|nr:CpaF family protein [Anaerolineales bacterium]
MSQTSPASPADLAKIRHYLLASVVNQVGAQTLEGENARKAVFQALSESYRQANIQLTEPQRKRIFREVMDELFGLGPLQPLLDDPEIAEIMVNGANLVFIERLGELIETGIQFEDDAHVLRIINRIIQPLGRRVDAESPTVDARLADGSRVNAVIPPVAVDGPYISIRKFLPNKMTLPDLVGLGALTPHMAEFLQACVAARLNILITGGTSSGKTTMLNVLSGMIPGRERILTIEDAVELQLKQRHVVRMETRPATVDRTGEVTTRDLVRNALRMRPDRIVVGEVRGGEALDMLQAMNTGHSGSLTTLHANSPRDAIARIETMALMAGLELPLLALRRQIASAIQLIVHQTRLQDGTRKTTQITEVGGMESDIVTLSDIFRFDATGVGENGKILGELRPTGIRPMFSPRLEVVGYKLRGEIFGAGKPLV